MVTYRPPEQVEREAAAKGSCRHRWIIAPPDGSIHLWTCRDCGVELRFKDNLEDYRTHTEEDRQLVLDVLFALAKLGVLLAVGRFLTSFLSC